MKGKSYRIQIGWDKPLKQYYYVISPLIVENNDIVEDDPVDSNLFRSSPVSLEDVELICSNFGITLPDTLVSSVRSDMLRDAVNEVQFYD